MSKVFITHKVEDVKRWKSFDAEREKNLGTFATNIKSYIDINGGNSVALSMDLIDPEGMREFHQTETCEALLVKHGVIKPIITLGDGT